MKPYFDQDGHLTGRAFDDLLHGEPDELARLEIAEHLAFCDHCTERYTARLCEDERFPPRKRAALRDAQPSRQRAVQLFFNRYVAAGVAALPHHALMAGRRVHRANQFPYAGPLPKPDLLFAAIFR